VRQASGRRVIGRSMAILNSRVVRLFSSSILVGIIVGIVGSGFRYLLAEADQLRNALVYWLREWPHIGWMIPVVLGALAAGLARIMVVVFSPSAGGSGVQHVEAVVSGQKNSPSLAVVPVKFIGGLLAIGSGLALGREGPTVQMGASLGTLVSRFLVPDEDDHKILHASGAGAGLAVAFNTPIGGAVFVFEELVRSFAPMLMIATLAAISVAVWLMRMFLGNVMDFTVKSDGSIHVWHLWTFLILGMILGAVGAFFNAVTVALLSLSDHLSNFSSVNRAVFIGGVIGVVVWLAPTLVGGGEALTQAVLVDRYATGGLLFIFLVRFLLGPWSYVAGTPGGLFAPLLVVGASFGALFAALLNLLIPAMGLPSVAFALAGMAALFTASVRAPLTGIVLVVEMTGRGDLTLALLVASAGAMVVAMMLKSEPIYESLKRRMLQQPMVQGSSPGLIPRLRESSSLQSR
jgi:CIC family chloride channel protein